MSDPNRLLDDPSLSPLARSILRSADGDGPSADGRRRVAAAIGLGTVSGAAATAAGAASSLWWKVPLIVLGLVGAGTATYVMTRRSTEELARPVPVQAPVRSRPPGAAPHAVDAEATPAIAPVTAHAPATATAPVIAAEPARRITTTRAIATAPARTPSTRSAITATAAVPPTATATAPATAAATDPATGAGSDSDSDPTISTDPAGATETSTTVGAAAQVDPRSLAAEVAVLDRARGQLQHHDLAGALATLDQHARAFPGGALAAEAEMLRIQATLAAGDRAAAAALARAFLQHFPDSPLAPRARAIVDGARSSP